MQFGLGSTQVKSAFCRNILEMFVFRISYFVYFGVFRISSKIMANDKKTKFQRTYLEYLEDGVKCLGEKFQLLQIFRIFQRFYSRVFQIGQAEIHLPEGISR